MNWITRFVSLVLLIVVVILAITAIPTLLGGHLEGKMLLVHMMASGVMVFVLPVFGGLMMFRSATPPWQRGLAWFVLATGLATLLTMFACMSPILSTDQMRTVVTWHGWVGFVFSFLVVILMIFKPFRSGSDNGTL